MINIWDNYSRVKALYNRYIEAVCRRYDLNRAELDVLLFFANNPEYDRAADIVRIYRVAKSQVSTALRALQDRGYVAGEFEGKNRRSIHIKVLPEAHEVVEEGRRAQRKFADVLVEGFRDEELQQMRNFAERITDNIKKNSRKNEKGTAK